MVHSIALKKFESIYLKHFAGLCRVVFRMVHDTEIARDIVQEVYIKYWQKIHELPDNHQPFGYLYRACINQTLNYLKENHRRSTREQVFASNKITSRASWQPDQKLQHRETNQLISKAIDALPPACKAAFVLSRYEQKSYKQIAGILDISVNTVEKQIGKALKTLRQALHTR